MIDLFQHNYLCNDSSLISDGEEPSNHELKSILSNLGVGRSCANIARLGS
jgi:hypothetical protein